MGRRLRVGPDDQRYFDGLVGTRAFNSSNQFCTTIIDDRVSGCDDASPTGPGDWKWNWGNEQRPLETRHARL